MDLRERANNKLVRWQSRVVARAPEMFADRGNRLLPGRITGQTKSLGNPMLLVITGMGLYNTKNERVTNFRGSRIFAIEAGGTDIARRQHHQGFVSKYHSGNKQ